MLKILESIEEKLNGLILRLLALLKMGFFKLVSKEKLHSYYSSTLKLKNSMKTKLKGQLLRVHKLVVNTKQLPSKATAYSKHQAEILKDKLKSSLKHQRLKQIGLELLGKLKTQEFTLSLVILSMLSLGTWGIYTSAKSIYTKELSSRSPASLETFEYLYMPDYLKLEARSVEVYNLQIPVYSDGPNSIRSITVDLNIRTDTRFASQFLKHYGYKVKDYFFSSTEPIKADFAIQEEGKVIIKEKIKDELNRFLEQENVEGKVIDVDMIDIIAS